MVSFTVNGELGQSARLNAQLDALANNIKQRQKLAHKLGGYVRTNARKNIRKQKLVGGAPMPPRKQQRRDRRILQGLADPEEKSREMSVISRAGEGGGVVVSWKNRLTAGIAYGQQHGVGVPFTAQQAARERGTPDYAAPCTRLQAKALIKEGYRLMVPRKGGGRRPKRVTVLWLEKHFTIGHAGIVLRMMRTGKARGPQAWSWAPKPRPFLGVSSAEATKMSERLIKTVLGAVPR